MNESSAATESTGVVPIASRSERAVSTAPSAFVVSTTRSAAASGILVRRALDAELGRGGLRALGVARADHDVVAGLAQPDGERRPEAAGASDQGDLHVACLHGCLQGRLGEPAGGLAVAHERIRDDERRTSARLRRRVGAVDHERVEQALVTLCHMRGGRPADEALHHAVERAAHGAAADQRADGDGAHAARLERRADPGHGEDRVDRDERVARGDHDRVGGGERLEDAGGRPGRVRAVVDERVDLVLVPAGDEPLLERERALRGDDVRAERGRPSRAGAGSRGPPPRASPAVTAESGSPAPERLRADEMEAEVEVAEHEPALAAPGARRLERLPGLAGAPPAALGVVEPGEAVEHRVEVGRDVEAEHLEVVADVADHRQLARREHVVEAGRELRAADAAREQDDLHDVTAASARVREPARTPMRSRSAAVSTSSRRFGRSRSWTTSPSAVACALNRAALPGP